jgi:restriction enzyme, beta subunit
MNATKITLPTHNGDIDYNFMQNLVRTIEKLVIKEVVLYAEKKIQATQEAIK